MLLENEYNMKIRKFLLVGLTASTALGVSAENTDYSEPDTEIIRYIESKIPQIKEDAVKVFNNSVDEINKLVNSNQIKVK